MKQRMAFVLMACAALVAAGPRSARAAVDLSASIQINADSDFYSPLQPYGAWVDVSSYGRCWHPAHVAADWEPYTVGSWEWTDAGWYWQSDEPWAWACYHYGSWYNEPSVGWVWIPGTDWAPAWVTWRDSDDYVGWAPCGPGLSVLAPSFFVFCDIHHFHDHFGSRRDFVVNNTTIINRTRVIKNFQRQSVDFNGRQRTIFANRGPGVDPIQRATGQKFTARPVRDVIQQEHRPENMRRDEGTRPEQRPAADQRPAPTGRDQQRNYQQQPQREQTPAPTGREQQRNYQQPSQKTPDVQHQQQQEQQLKQQQEQQNRQQQQREQTPSPTGRELQRNYQQPTPAQRAPETPQQRPPATHEAPVPAQPREVTPPRQQPKEVPTPSQRPTPSERPLPPTGREATPAPRETAPREAAPVQRAPEVRQAPAPHAPADGHGQDGRDGKDGNRNQQ
ncbi:MAG TPA: DUF6600 domain-containing protein [Verrucomicrobiae bacterium]|jgi:hypothetical protein|nr:DUF6600 domain-containing protein [Verrucomicrobiae bacterium]